MKVRLKQLKVKSDKRDNEFQFHEGPIKTSYRKLHNRTGEFQFHEGPIKTTLSL